jgi:F-type H+-transporting ATPase subunit alpha
LRFESELLDFLRRNTKILTTIRETNNLENDTVAELEKAVAKFKRGFQTKSGEVLASTGAATAAGSLDEEDVNQEKIVKQKRKK